MGRLALGRRRGVELDRGGLAGAGEEAKGVGGAFAAAVTGGTFDRGGVEDGGAGFVGEPWGGITCDRAFVRRRYSTPSSLRRRTGP